MSPKKTILYQYQFATWLSLVTFVIVIFLFSLIVRRGLNWMVMKIKLGAGQQQKKRSENLTQLWL